MCGPQVGLYECLFEGVNAFKRIQMGDGDDDGAVLHSLAQGCFVLLLVCVCLHARLTVCVAVLSTSVTQWG